MDREGALDEARRADAGAGAVSPGEASTPETTSAETTSAETSTAHTTSAETSRAETSRAETSTVLRRLERIEALDRERAPVSRLLGELRELVREAEAWARVEGDDPARDAVGKLREGRAGMS